ncbi:glycosyltransferase [Lacticaseibacillus zhaodongensis]|uniref:glycosyltransferase n=1 Tax=Lacticaseibacillus zhaodongensis TaxID=2668065 RepID=UPI0012D352D3|nr:glycosyltransferase [Lacticaseibacillus zhaodongensis]
MRILMTLENLKVDGVKRASTVVANSLAEHNPLWYYSLAPVMGTPIFDIKAPIITATPPVTSGIANFFGTKPYSVYHDQILDLIRTVKRLRIDVVILPGGLLTSFAPFLKRAVPGVKLIGWMHNNYATYMNDYYGQMQAEFEAGMNAVDELVVLTDADLNAYAYCNPNTQKLYNPITLQPKHHSNLDSRIIAFTGRIDIRHKGVDLLLEAIPKLRSSWQVAIAGAGKPADQQWFEAHIQDPAVKDRIIYRGPLDDAGLHAHYEAASMFVSTSRWEGMPLVIGEAMAAGLPIVAMANTGSTEFIKNDQYGLLTPAMDVNAFSAGVNALIDNVELRAYYAEQSLIRAQDFSLEAVRTAWERELLQIAAVA